MPLPTAPDPAAPSPAPSPAPGSEASLPDGVRLLALEARARAAGSGLDAASVVGCWVFAQVWPRAGGAPVAAASALLRGLAARLEIAPAPAPAPVGGAGEDGDPAAPLALVNRVRLGALELRFEGTGRLRGRRPLLVFWFDRWQLRLAGRTLLERPLAPPEPKRRPFFALIGRGRTAAGADWLAARGRGGGLALWCLEASGPSTSPSAVAAG